MRKREKGKKEHRKDGGKRKGLKTRSRGDQQEKAKNVSRQQTVQPTRMELGEPHPPCGRWSAKSGGCFGGGCCLVTVQKKPTTQRGGEKARGRGGGGEVPCGGRWGGGLWRRGQTTGGGGRGWGWRKKKGTASTARKK